MLAQVVGYTAPIWETFHNFSKELKLESPLAYLDTVSKELKPGEPYAACLMKIMNIDLESAFRHFHLSAMIQLDEPLLFFRNAQLTTELRLEKKFDLILASGTGPEWLSSYGYFNGEIDTVELQELATWVYQTFSRLGFGTLFE